MADALSRPHGRAPCGRCNRPKPCKCGRPLKFTSVEDLEVRINQYFDECDRDEDTRVYAHEGREIEEGWGIGVGSFFL